MKHIKRDLSLKVWVLSPECTWGRSLNSIFSEYCDVAYQIKGNDACINMVANILSIDPLP